jgi:hypothetical protein
MQQSETWEPLCQGESLTTPAERQRARGRATVRRSARHARAALSVPDLLRSRTRTRRRRRKRSWGAQWAYLPVVFLVYGTLWVGPVLFSVSVALFTWDVAKPQRVFVSLHHHQRGLTHPLFDISLPRLPTC